MLKILLKMPFMVCLNGIHPSIRIRDTGYGIQDTGYGIRDTGYGIRDTGYGIRDTDADAGYGRGYEYTFVFPSVQFNDR